MRSYAPTMSIQRLFAILVAVAVLFAPAFSSAGEARASVSDHHAQMMEAGHCQTPASDSGDQEKAPAKSCCISMCMGIAITPVAPAKQARLNPDRPAFAVPTFHLGYLGEIATPPPRRS
jgi:hypothetical protein